MKKIISAALILALVLCSFAACGAKPEKAIIGTWTGTKDLKLVEAKYEFTFNEDGTGTMSTPGIDLGVAMTYTIDGDVLTVNTSVLGITNTNTYTMAFDKDTLTLTNGEDVINLIKQAQ